MPSLLLTSINIGLVRYLYRYLKYSVYSTKTVAMFVCSLAYIINSVITRNSLTAFSNFQFNLILFRGWLANQLNLKAIVNDYVLVGRYCKRKCSKFILFTKQNYYELHRTSKYIVGLRKAWKIFHDKIKMLKFAT